MKNTGFIITGASSGLGFALAEYALTQGASVFGISRREPAIAHSEKFTWQTADLANSLDSEILIHSAFQFFQEQKIEKIVLINNAGSVAPMTLCGHYPEPDVTQSIALNVTAPILLTNAFAALLPENIIGSVLTISSGAAHTPYAGWGVYCATKSAIDHFSRVFAVEQNKIKVVSLAPGVVDTGMQASIRQTNSANFPLVEQFVSMKEKDQLVSAADAAQKIMIYIQSPNFGAEVVVDIRNIK